MSVQQDAMRTQRCVVPGQVRGVWLRRWAAHCQRRWGEGAVQRVRTAAGVPVAVLPDAPDERGWYPAAAQLAVTQAVIDLYLDGERARLQPLFEADALADLSRLQRLALRAWGPSRAYARLASLHPELCDVGTLHVALDGRGGELTYRGAPLFAEPLWRDLQRWAHGAALALLAGAGQAVDLGGAADEFRLRLSW